MPTVLPPGHVESPVVVVGDGRMGRSLIHALRMAGVEARGPEGRGAAAKGAGVVLLAVPDSQIATAAAAIAPGPPVGHLSGASTLLPLSPHEAFSLHPLMTVTGVDVSFAGIPAAVAASTGGALRAAEGIASVLGLRTFPVSDADRGAYHAAASIASNFLVTLEGIAERLAGSAGVERSTLVPLVRATVENWASLGAPAALTGPVTRGDEETLRRQRSAVAERVPDSLAVFDALVDATRMLHEGRPHGASSSDITTKGGSGA